MDDNEQVPVFGFEAMMPNMGIDTSGSFKALRTNDFTSANNNLTRSLVLCADAPAHVPVGNVIEPTYRYEELTPCTEIMLKFVNKLKAVADVTLRFLALQSGYSDRSN